MLSRAGAGEAGTVSRAVGRFPNPVRLSLADHSVPRHRPGEALHVHPAADSATAETGHGPGSRARRRGQPEILPLAEDERGIRCAANHL